jgi:CO/xanthine dehydrogenase Mo-binding subunit
LRECPEISVEILSRPELPSLGAGECATGPTAAAIGNAIAHAIGVRMRHLPITAARIADAIASRSV